MIPNKKSIPSHKAVTLLGTVVLKDGKRAVNLKSLPLYNHFLNTYCKVGDEVSMKLTSKRPKRSELQNNLYHVYLHLISLSTGNSVENLKSWVNQEILAKGITEVFGISVRKLHSSSKLTISEFAEMMNEIEERTGIPIPDSKPFGFALTHQEHKKLVEEEENRYKKLSTTPS